MTAQCNITYLAQPGTLACLASPVGFECLPRLGTLLFPRFSPSPMLPKAATATPRISLIRQ